MGACAILRSSKAEMAGMAGMAGRGGFPPAAGGALPQRRPARPDPSCPSGAGLLCRELAAGMQLAGCPVSLDKLVALTEESERARWNGHGGVGPVTCALHGSVGRPSIQHCEDAALAHRSPQ